MTYDREAAKEKFAKKNARRKAGREGVRAQERIDARNLRRNQFPVAGAFGNAGQEEWEACAKGTTGAR